MCFSKTTTSRDNKGNAGSMSSLHYKYPDFPRQVKLEYGKLREEDGLAGWKDAAPRRLILFKRAMVTAAGALSMEQDIKTAEDSLEKIEWAMAFIRAAEKQNMHRMKQCSAAYPYISDFCNAEDPEARSKPGFQQ